MRLKEYSQSIGNAIYIMYFLGTMITFPFLMILSRWQCIQDNGFLGIFWCDVFASIYSSIFKAFLWPYFLYQWLSS